MLTLVLGGTRSGKSARAETLAAQRGRPVRYVATAEAADPGMAERVARHRAQRPAAWETVQASDALSDALDDLGEAIALVDGIGTWIAGVLHRDGAFDGTPAVAARARVLAEVDSLIARARATDVIVVAEQAGEGLLPADAASREWLDLLGGAVARLSAAAAHAELVVAGRVLTLPGPTAGVGMPDATLRTHGDTLVRPGDADHAVNVLAGGPPDWLREELHRALDADGDRYPNEAAAIEALAALHGRAPEEVVPTNGAAEALWLLGPALRPRLAACVHPGFTETEAALHAHGVPVVRVLRDPERGFALDPATVPDDADLVVLGNPASPSGTLAPAATVLALRRPGRTVVVDEAFMDLVPGEPASLAGESLEDVVVVRSLTKSLALPGVRAGYLLAAPATAARLRGVRPPWSANAIALAALTAVARCPEALAAAADRSDAERRDLFQRLSAIDGVRVWPGAANFLLADVGDADRVAAALRAQCIAVRPAASFPGLDGRHVRITARAPEDNARLAAALRRELAQQAPDGTAAGGST